MSDQREESSKKLEEEEDPEDIKYNALLLLFKITI
jgi:hypothetical protein